MSGQDLSYLYPLYPIVGGIAIILCAIPIPAHWRAGNIATIMLGLWDLGMAIIVWIGTIVWHNNIDNPNPIWGDIVNFYYAMFPTALASTTFCIQYRLWSIARARSVFITKKEVRIVTFFYYSTGSTSLSH
jgi:pheromone a factor receptor